MDTNLTQPGGFIIIKFQCSVTASHLTSLNHSECIFSEENNSSILKFVLCSTNIFVSIVQLLVNGLVDYFLETNSNSSSQFLVLVFIARP